MKEELREMAEKMFGDLVKAVVDIDKKVMVVDADLHADQEQQLLRDGVEQNSLWRINLYPNESEEFFVEFDLMINLRPSYRNYS